jgi:hypothetical protein
MGKYILNPERILKNSANLNIPKTGEQVENTAQLIIQTFGLNALKSGIYKVGIDAAEVINTQQEAQLAASNKYKNLLPVTPEIDSYNNEDFSYLPTYQSKLGTPVMSDLDIDPKQSSGLPRIQIPTVLFTINQKKNIISTGVQGRNGTVKEYISDGDFNINVKGVLVGDNGKYPKLGFASTSKGGVASVDYLISLFQINKALEVNSWFLKQFNIYSIVITDYNFPQNEGEYSVQPFEFNAISDVPFELNITK